MSLYTSIFTSPTSVVERAHLSLLDVIKRKDTAAFQPIIIRHRLCCQNRLIRRRYSQSTDGIGIYCIWPFSSAVTVAISTAPSVAPVQTVNGAGSTVVRDGKSAASSVAAAPVTPAATVDFHADQPTTSFVDQPASSVAIRAPKRALPLRTASFTLPDAQAVGNKSSATACTLDEGCYDAFLITETWHTTSEDVALRRCVPPDYMSLDIPRPSTIEVRTNHGGK